jgi:hypothetical protein
VLFAVVCALIAVVFISAALQRQMPLLGPLPAGVTGWLLRLLLILAGLLLGVPNLGLGGLGPVAFATLGVLLALPALVVAFHAGRRCRPAGARPG